VYPFVPAMIKYYLGEDPILPNVPTYDCTDDAQRQHVVAHLGDLVVKNANQSATGCSWGRHRRPSSGKNSGSRL
jgi:uncharacterized circularly permuted ATP-grasp superfamily protein